MTDLQSPHSHGNPMKKHEDDMAAVAEIVDLETNAASGKPAPRANGYRIRVNAEHFVIAEPEPTREAILTVAGRTPPERFNLFLKVRGQNLVPVQPGQRTDLRQPGVEKFKVLPRDQTEGSH